MSKLDRTLTLNRPRARGLTVVELLVGLGLGGVILSVLWAFLLLGRRGEKASETDAALQVAMRVQERIERDLRGLVTPPGHFPIQSIGPAAHPNRDLAFFTFDPTRSSDLTLPVVSVAYRNHEGRLWRVAGDRATPLGDPYLQAGTFEVIDSRVGPMIIITLTLGVESRPMSTRFVHRIRIPGELGREDLAASYPFREDPESLRSSRPLDTLPGSGTR